MKAKCIMVQGTASSVGKSLITAGLCRIFKQDGYAVAPFKSQNMALNSFITSKGHEMGRAQVVQAEAAGIEPDVSMNPILLKPTTDQKAQVILNGTVHGNMSAAEYHAYKPKLAGMVRETYEKLAEEHDVIVIEGAGSPAEINLRENDLVNMGMAEIADAPVILVGDIDRGGVFASVAGTIMLLSEAEKARVKGVIINKFRGDVEILKPGLKMLEDIIHIPVLGVLPYTKLNIDDEDSLSERLSGKPAGDGEDVRIAVVRLPHISNYTDFNIFEQMQGVGIRYIEDPSGLGQPDLIFLPGSKNTIEDMLFLRESGFEAVIRKLHREGTAVFGICGGYQMLGKHISDPYLTESSVPEIQGMGLLDIHTVFNRKKVTTQVEAVIINADGVLAGTRDAVVRGYEIHMGKTVYGEECMPFVANRKVLGQDCNVVSGVRNKEGNVLGSYIHGIFDNIEFTSALVNRLRCKKGLEELQFEGLQQYELKQQQYDRLAGMLREHLDMDWVYGILNGEV